MCHSFAHFSVGFIRSGRPGAQPVDIAVIHTKRSGYQHGIVNLQVGGAKFAGKGNILIGNVFTVSLHLVGDVQQRPQFIRNRGYRQSYLDIVNQVQSGF